MIRIEQAIIVEGKYDKIKLESIIDAVIIETGGFSVFNDKEKQILIRRLAQKKGIVILTDSDSAGFLIRGFLKGCLPKDRVFNAYIPDVFGKEKRKSEPSKEGKLGVEGVDKQLIIKALERAGVAVDDVSTESRRVTSCDLFEDGFSGGKDSKKKRGRLIKKLDFPEKITTPAMLELINAFMSFEEYKDVVKEINGELSDCGG